jgi:predicted PurR-regulated permease PerM
MFALVWALIRFEGSWRSIWVIFTVLALVVPLTSGNFSSDTRFGLLAFPLVWPIAAWLEHGTARRTSVIAAAGVVVIVVLVLQLKYAYP